MPTMTAPRNTTSARRPVERAVERATASEQPPLPKRQLALVSAVLLAVMVAVTAGAWGLSFQRGEEEPDWVKVPGGWMLASQVVDKMVDHSGMPNMKLMRDPDPVPDGFTRITVGVALAAEDGDIRWRERDFVLRGTGMSAVYPHRAQMGSRLIRHGTQQEGGLTFEIPQEAKDLVLRFRDGTPARLVLHDHSSHDHDH